jgi:hypothetical protein
MGPRARAKDASVAGKPCYLCGEPIDPARHRWNRDHVPPRRLFASAVRKQFHVSELKSLPTHVHCNTAAERDEAYFVVSFAGQVQTDVAMEVMKDIRRQARMGEGLGLLRTVMKQFGQIVGPRGEVMFTYDTNRVNRFLWKIARGLFALETGRVLPQDPPRGIELVNPKTMPDELAAIRWFPAVRNTGPLGRYGRVFDYKWIGWKDGNLRGHAMAMNFWDGLVAALLFHDPGCACGLCDEWHGRPSTGTNRGDNQPQASVDANTEPQIS